MLDLEKNTLISKEHLPRAGGRVLLDLCLVYVQPALVYKWPGAGARRERLDIWIRASKDRCRR